MCLISEMIYVLSHAFNLGLNSTTYSSQHLSEAVCDAKYIINVCPAVTTKRGNLILLRTRLEQ